MQKSFAVAKFVYRVVSFVALIMKPAVAFLSLSTNVVLKLFGMKTEAEEETVTEEEIRLMVSSVRRMVPSTVMKRMDSECTGI